MEEKEYFGICEPENGTGRPTYIPVKAISVAIAYWKVWAAKPKGHKLAKVVEKKTGVTVWQDGETLPI